MWKTIPILSVLITFGFSSVIAQIRPPPKVTLPNGGTLLGSFMFSTKRNFIEAYRGIPYAKPPIGNLRFANAVPFPPWTGDRIADHDAQPCPQQDRFGLDRTYFGNEDCLYLNVYTPTYRPLNASLSVMVFFHGGGFLYGGSSSAIYGPQRLLDDNVVLVTSNYRLGALGFLSTGTADSPGNNGLKDQIMALKWVKENIDAFGGNPADVTIFGHSAGAASVAYHLVSPLSQGLFHKAIMQSGTSFDPWALINLDTAIERAEKVGEVLNCTENNHTNPFSYMIECLRGKSSEEITLTTEEFYIVDDEPMNVFGPVIEPKELAGAFLTQHPMTIKTSYGTNVPLMIGVTSDEGVFKSAPILHNYEEAFENNFAEVLPTLLVYDELPIAVQDEITSKINTFYFKGERKWSKRKHHNLTNLFSDRLFYFGMDQFLRNRLTNGNSSSTYVYVFDHKGPRSLSQLYGGGQSYYGVAHGDELPFLFPLAQDHLRGSRNDEKMRWAMPKMWTDFAKTGEPTPPHSSVTEKWLPATEYPLNFARIGNKVYKNKWNPDDYSKINVTEESETHVSHDQSTDENEVGEKQRLDDRDPVVNGGLRTARKHHHSKHKKNKKNKSSRNYHYLVVKNELGLAEKRMAFWHNLQAFIEKAKL